ncbi:MAG: hypothetical protein U0992_18700 [Planctomycetaceae bacterium]
MEVPLNSTSPLNWGQHRRAGRPACTPYRYYGDELPLPQLISEIPSLPQGGTLAVLLGCHALQRGLPGDDLYLHPA